ncbi:MAG: hypothetical protein ACOC95_08190 [Planctomycetota bacterium]
MTHHRQPRLCRALVVAVLVGVSGNGVGEDRSAATAPALAPDSEALSALLARTASLGDEDELLQQAEVVGVEGLLNDPEAYRGELVAIHVVIWRVTALTPEATTQSRDALAVGRAVWRVDCTDRRPDRAGVGDPLIVLVTDLPESLSAREYPAGVKATAYGLFHKVVTRGTERPEQARAVAKTYPVLVARTLYGVGAEPGDWGKIILLVGVVVLAIGYALARRAARRAGRGTDEGGAR